MHRRHSIDDSLLYAGDTDLDCGIRGDSVGDWGVVLPHVSVLCVCTIKDEHGINLFIKSALVEVVEGWCLNDDPIDIYSIIVIIMTDTAESNHHPELVLSVKRQADWLHTSKSSHVQYSMHMRLSVKEPKQQHQQPFAEIMRTQAFSSIFTLSISTTRSDARNSHVWRGWIHDNHKRPMRQDKSAQSEQKMFNMEMLHAMQCCNTSSAPSDRY